MEKDLLNLGFANRAFTGGGGAEPSRRLLEIGLGSAENKQSAKWKIRIVWYGHRPVTTRHKGTSVAENQQTPLTISPSGFYWTYSWNRKVGPALPLTTLQVLASGTRRWRGKYGKRKALFHWVGDDGPTNKLHDVAYDNWKIKYQVQKK